MKLLKNILLIGALLGSTSSFGAMITNGDFATSCDLNSWDQYGEVSLNVSAGNCAAELSVNDNSFEAELSQSVVFEDSFDYLLSVDFVFNTSLAVIDDLFFISFINGTGDLYDLLLPEDFNIGANSLAFSFSSADLIHNYTNQDWSLSFYLFDQFYDASNSTVLISNASLNKITSQVPEPGSLAIFALGLAGLISRRKLTSESIGSVKNKLSGS